jgi:hypothetical protein
MQLYWLLYPQCYVTFLTFRFFKFHLPAMPSLPQLPCYHIIKTHLACFFSDPPSCYIIFLFWCLDSPRVKKHYPDSGVYISIASLYGHPFFLSKMVFMMILIDHNTRGARMGNIRHFPRTRPWLLSGIWIAQGREPSAKQTVWVPSFPHLLGYMCHLSNISGNFHYCLTVVTYVETTVCSVELGTYSPSSVKR